MIKLIYTDKKEIRDSLTNLLSLQKRDLEFAESTIYGRGEWILVYSPKKSIIDIIHMILENFIPDRLYLPVLGRAIDVVHEIGDVILPNVFLTYNPLLDTAEINEENRDSFLGAAKFLELYNEQKDYYVEDFGLSIGGIIVDGVPLASFEMNDKLMLAYEADIYVEDPLKPIYEVALSDELPTILSAGIVEGKTPKNMNGTAIDHTMRNMIATWRLLEEDIK